MYNIPTNSYVVFRNITSRVGLAEISRTVFVFGGCGCKANFDFYSSGLLRRPSEYAWISFALFVPTRIPHSFLILVIYV